LSFYTQARRAALISGGVSRKMLTYISSSSSIIADDCVIFFFFPPCAQNMMMLTTAFFLSPFCSYATRYAITGIFEEKISAGMQCAGSAASDAAFHHARLPFAIACPRGRRSRQQCCCPGAFDATRSQRIFLPFFFFSSPLMRLRARDDETLFFSAFLAARLHALRLPCLAASLIFASLL